MESKHNVVSRPSVPLFIFTYIINFLVPRQFYGNYQRHVFVVKTVEQLTRIQRDVLIIIVGIGPTEGVTISDELNGYYYSSVTTQQVYHALDGLIEMGLITKNSAGKSNYYRVTTAGKEALSQHRAWQETVRSTVESE